MPSLPEILCLKSRLYCDFPFTNHKKSCEQREVEVGKEKDNFDWEVNVFTTGAQ